MSQEFVVLHGAQGEDNGNSKLTNAQVYRIRELYDTGLLKQSEIAKLFNVSQRMISIIIRKEGWIHI